MSRASSTTSRRSVAVAGSGRPARGPEAGPEAVERSRPGELLSAPAAGEAPRRLPPVAARVSRHDLPRSVGQVSRLFRRARTTSSPCVLILAASGRPALVPGHPPRAVPGGRGRRSALRARATRAGATRVGAKRSRVRRLSVRHAPSRDRARRIDAPRGDCAGSPGVRLTTPRPRPGRAASGAACAPASSPATCRRARGGGERPSLPRPA
jgi:hypothetical protein